MLHVLVLWEKHYKMLRYIKYNYINTMKVIHQLR